MLRGMATLPSLARRSIVRCCRMRDSLFRGVFLSAVDEASARIDNGYCVNKAWDFWHIVEDGSSGRLSLVECSNVVGKADT